MSALAEWEKLQSQQTLLQEQKLEEISVHLFTCLLLVWLACLPLKLWSALTPITSLKICLKYRSVFLNKKNTSERVINPLNSTCILILYSHGKTSTQAL